MDFKKKYYKYSSLNSTSDKDYYSLYCKYKNKYLKLKKQIGGDELTIKSEYIRQLLKGYSKIPINTEDVYMYIYSERGTGFGDVTACFKAYKILSGIFKNIFIGFDSNYINFFEKMLHKKCETITFKMPPYGEEVEIHALKDRGCNFLFSGNKNWTKLDVYLKQTYKNNIIKICTPVYIHTDESNDDIVIHEYGYREGEFEIKSLFNENGYFISSGLGKDEIGIYIDDLEYNENECNFFAYFSEEGVQYLKFYFYVILKEIFSKYEYYNSCEVTVYLPNSETLLDDIYESNRLTFRGVTFNKDEKIFIKNSDTSLSFQSGSKTITAKLFTKKLSNSEFKELLCKSHKYVGCTGDQSITETLSCNKLPIYEISGHKTEFFEDLISLTKDNNFTKLYDYFNYYYEIMKKSYDKSKFQELYNKMNDAANEMNYFRNFLLENYKIDDYLIGITKCKIIQKMKKEELAKQPNDFESVIKEEKKLLESIDELEKQDLKIFLEENKNLSKDEIDFILDRIMNHINQNNLPVNTIQHLIVDLKKNSYINDATFPNLKGNIGAYFQNIKRE